MPALGFALWRLEPSASLCVPSTAAKGHHIHRFGFMFLFQKISHWLRFPQAAGGFLWAYVVQLSARGISILCSELECRFFCSSGAVWKLWISGCFPSSELWYPAPLAGKALFFPATNFAAIALGVGQCPQARKQFLHLRVVVCEI